MQITVSHVRRHLDVMRIILRHFPTLDTLAIIFNSDLYYVRIDGIIVSFATRKKYGNAYELGTIYTHPNYRGRGYAQEIISAIAGMQPSLFVLCDEKLKGFYERLGFTCCNTNELPIITLRRNAFNIFLRPLFHYTLVSLRTTKGSPRSYFS